VTLNSLVAACLLQERSETMQISDLILRTGTIYKYLKLKTKACTYMQVYPQ
jgi:hypothetical protein